MKKNRLEALSDGVFAIIITIMVLELKIPRGANLVDLVQVLPILGSYVVSFLYLAIYWNSHHHLLQATERITGGVLWANFFLLFWLSLFPFGTAWVHQAGLNAQGPMVAYGIILLMAGIGYWIMLRVLLRVHEPDSTLHQAIGSNRKENLSLILYMVGIVAALKAPLVSASIYLLVAFIWLVPDRRIEKAL